MSEAQSVITALAMFRSDLSRIERKVDKVLIGLGIIYQEQHEMSKELDTAISDLTAEVTNLQSVDASAIAVIKGIPKLIEDAIASAKGDDAAAVAAVRDALEKVRASDTELSAAVVANTPAAPTEPAPAPA